MCFSALVRREAKYLEARFGAIAVREQYEEYEERSSREPTKFPPLADRIFPGHYAPILHDRAGRRVAELMRYNIDPPGFITGKTKLTCYNARRDNLSSPFWADAFLKHHGLVVLAGFYEWVAVADLLKTGTVTSQEVVAEFHRQAAARKAKLNAAGKPYKATPTELKDPRFRRIIIEFKAEGENDLLVPVVFTERTESGTTTRGFAIVTDEPPPEVSAAGHDRCPVVLTRAAADRWLGPAGRTVSEMQAVLDERPELRFRYLVDKVS